MTSTLGEVVGVGGWDENRIYSKFASIQSAINLDGQGDGARIKLDVPRSDIDAVLRLQGLAGQSFKVVIDDGRNE